MFRITQLPSVETFSNLSHHSSYILCMVTAETFLLKHNFEIHSLKSLTQESRKECAIKTFHVNPIKIGSPTAKNLNNN